MRLKMKLNKIASRLVWGELWREINHQDWDQECEEKGSNNSGGKASENLSFVCRHSQEWRPLFESAEKVGVFSLELRSISNLCSFLCQNIGKVVSASGFAKFI